MSENTPTPEELVKTVHFTIERATPTVGFQVNRANVVPTPIDPTLTIQGEAADAYATGQAIAAVWDGATINGISAVNKAFTIYALNILMSGESGAQNIAQAIESVSNRTADDIMYDAENLITIKSAIDGIKTTIDSELTEEEIDTIFDEVFGEDDD